MRYRAVPVLVVLACGVLFLVGLDTAVAGTREIIAGSEYDKSALHNWWLGENYREVWLAPIEVEVLDLQQEAGGLTPLFRVGGTQTPGLALEGADGRSYTFRAVNKNQRGLLPPEWRDSVMADQVQDQVSATHPGVSPVINGFTEALPWMVQPANRLVILPDDPALGEFRETFAGMLGSFGEYATAANDRNPGYRGATEILSSRDLWSRWQEGPERIDTELFLRYRIFDIWIGNWDRHSKQWRWAYLPDTDDWHPIAEDPDQVFSNYQGGMLNIVRWYIPKFLSFKDEISSMEGAAANGADIDRWVLVDLDRETFMQTARSVQAELTDEVIDTALRQMPAEWYAINGEQIAARLKQRRDNLLEGVDRYYEHLSGQVSIHGTDRDERLRIERFDDGSTSISLALVKDSKPYYQRRFNAGETKELRVFLYGGDDEVISAGPAINRIKVHVVGGDGNDSLDDSASGYTRFYDSEGINDVREGKRTKVDSHPYINPAASDDNPWLEPRDNGKWTHPVPYVYLNSELGLVLGAGFTRTSWSFRKYPYANQHSLMAKYATNRKSGEVSYSNSFNFRNSDWSLGGVYSVSGIKSINFFGFGNDTVSNDELKDQEFYEVDDTEFRIFPNVTWDSYNRLSLKFGPELKYSRETSTGTLIDLTQPYGSGKFGQLGLVAALDWRTRGLKRLQTQLARFDVPRTNRARVVPDVGFQFDVEGSWFPKVLDVEEDFTTLEAKMSGYYVIGEKRKVVLYGGVGGRKVWGRFPWREAAYVGGQKSNRGFDTNRFAGHSSLYGRAELQWHMFDALFFIPGRVWIYGLADAGRVWFDDNDPDDWHPSYGGGIALDLPASPLRFRVELAQNSDEGELQFYFSTGFSF